MNKILFFLIFIFFTAGCSFNKNSKFWTDSKNILEENNIDYKEIFVEERALEKELNSNVLINLENSYNNNFKIRNYFNNVLYMIL